MRLGSLSGASRRPGDPGPEVGDDPGRDPRAASLGRPRRALLPARGRRPPIARELLWNVVKHAGASESALAVCRNGDGLRITVSDDGVGFDAAEGSVLPTEDGSFGLFSARERLEHLGGSLEIDSAPGRGTRIVVTCPLAAAGQREGAK